MDFRCKNCFWNYYCEGDHDDDDCCDYFSYIVGEEPDDLTDYEQFRAQWYTYIKDFE